MYLVKQGQQQQSRCLYQVSVRRRFGCAGDGFAFFWVYTIVGRRALPTRFHSIVGGNFGATMIMSSYILDHLGEQLYVCGQLSNSIKHL
jgi:hypothetical protein